MKRLLLFSIIAFSFVVTANADIVVYDNGAGGAAGIDGNGGSDAGTNNIIADDFVLNTDADITGFEWTGLYINGGSPPVLDNFVFAVFADGGGVPTTVPIYEITIGNDDVNRVDSGFDLFSNDVYSYSANVDFMAEAGTTYWLTVYQDTPAGDDNFHWAFRGGPENFALGLADYSFWIPSTVGRFDFRLTSIPEPSSTFIGLIGLVSLMGRRRR